MELCELPRLPSELLLMREEGYSEEVCLAFDRASLVYVQKYRRMRDRTKQVPLPPSEKRAKPKPTKTVPFHTEEEILEFLGVNVKEEAETVKQLLGKLDTAMWDSLEGWVDDDDEIKEAG